MFSYNLVQWLFFFYFYCIIGWIWESSYVSVCDKKLTNRGFLNGPLLPIYGSGACIILMATLPVKSSIFLVFIFGMTAATVLEYVSGVVMESIFKIRYWDYSNEKFNLNGHICLICSLAWGVFSVLMVKLIHQPVEKLMYLIPYKFLEYIIIFITIIFVTDLTISVRDALDFKELLTKITENSEELKKLQKRFDVLIAIIDDEKNGITNKLGSYATGSKDKIINEFDLLKEKLIFEKDKLLFKHSSKKRSMRLLRRNPGATSKFFSDALKYFKTQNK